MGSRKQPSPPPDGITKPEPPPAPPLKVGRVHLGAHAGLPKISVDVPMPSVRPPRADRPWIFCADSLPETAGRYEVACWTTNGVLVGQPLRLFRFFSTFSEEGRWRLSNWSPPEGGHETVYAWRPITEAPPPLRPADRNFLLAAGVPADWLEPKGETR